MPWREHLLIRDDVRLACRDWGGPGQPVVLLHGLAGHAGEWDDLAERLSPTHRVVAVDQRGHGAAERHPHDVSRAAYVEDVVAVIGRLALHRPVLVGQSLGGHTAVLTAAAHPGLIRALALVEAGSGGPNPDLPANIGNWLDSWPVPFPSREAATAFFGGGRAGAGWAAGLEHRADGWWPRFDRDVMVRSLAELAQRSFHHEWTRVTCPTLLVLAQSGFIPADQVTEMFRLRPDIRAVSVPGTGHDVHLDAPEAVYGALSGFLAELA
ncbi:alpha/beta hydrolase [Streptomyces sp. A1277]|uniref:alpha/beta fold hydrolase n=1 Tax=Streptomyces sp. A1277 TaxID=2563103 RepID=UPI0010A23CC4|nr:alpha/beta hydrolase [Streptomyces sp. A1277]THA35488.1 alpha/beta hydrolase [Streptomyces sp. A1277]